MGGELLVAGEQKNLAAHGGVVICDIFDGHITD